MANIVTNIALGRVRELYRLVEENVLPNSALVLVPLETSGLESDAVLKDKDTLTDLVSGTTNEQTTMGRKILTDAQLAAVTAPDDSADKAECSLPTTIWTAAAGNPISKIAVCFDPDTTSGTDADLIPLTIFDFAATPSGIDIEMTGGVFFRAT